MVVSLARPGAEAAAEAFVRASRNRFSRRPIRVRYVEYSFDQLHRWKAVAAATRVPEAVFFDADEVTNRVTIGVTSESAVPPARVAAIEAGIPETALRFRVVGPGPHDRLRVTEHGGVGGTQFTDPNEPNFNPCTVGVTGTWNGRDVFVTASHCTAEKFQPGSTVAQQQFNGGSAVAIADEVHDPGYDGFQCEVLDDGKFGPRDCRRSDAAIYEWRPSIHDTGVTGDPYQPYRIAQTMSASTGAPGSKEIKASAPHFVVGYAVQGYDEIWVGMELNKMGQRTGWTKGDVMQCIDGVDDGNPRQWTNCDPPEAQATSTCFNYHLDATAETIETNLFCQFEALLYSDVGDSGAPVFTNESAFYPVPDEHTVDLLGILWGGPVHAGTEPDGTYLDDPNDGGADENELITWFSAWPGVVADLGSVDVCHPQGYPGC